MLFNDSVVYSIKNALDIASLRQNVITSNIANADTPNYKAKHIPFKNILEEQSENIQLKTGDAKHIVNDNHIFYNTRSLDHDYLIKNDNNNVKLDKEMTLLAKNTLLVNALTAFEKYKFNQYKDIISSTRNI